MRRSTKRSRDLIGSVTSASCTARRTRLAHLVVSRRAGAVFAGTLSDHRSFENSMADLSRAGFASLPE